MRIAADDFFLLLGVIRKVDKVMDDVAEPVLIEHSWIRVYMESIPCTLVERPVFGSIS